jgi:hypothetical protein
MIAATSARPRDTLRREQVSILVTRGKPLKQGERCLAPSGVGWAVTNKQMPLQSTVHCAQHCRDAKNSNDVRAGRPNLLHEVHQDCAVQAMHD